jgi:hypothetical protein
LHSDLNPAERFGPSESATRKLELSGGLLRRGDPFRAHRIEVQTEVGGNRAQIPARIEHPGPTDAIDPGTFGIKRSIVYVTAQYKVGLKLIDPL